MQDSDARREAVRSYLECIEDVGPNRLNRILDVITRGRELHETIDLHMARCGLSKTRFQILEELFFHPDSAAMPAALAETVGITRASMTTCIDGLEKLGYAVRTPHEKDRRSLLIRLTPEGRDHVASMLPDHYRALCGVLTRLTTEEADQLCHLYEKLTAGFREVLGDTLGSP